MSVETVAHPEGNGICGRVVSAREALLDDGHGGQLLVLRREVRVTARMGLRMSANGSEDGGENECQTDAGARGQCILFS